ncbi:IS200/IS605 family accessory protein TnpB-related protein [Thermus thermophilus]|uniref:Transposase, IS605 OrfB family, central region n=1 Tax=Thermus thermophilus JL-18 TaxID=798128 RepID=H9ZTH3_THETH|nr:IS200/IS605 family accessory protein TnpB-related protein [Thermus thermophilus]AFH39633.1 transposase, IS605 OrfB family, central region [Thermus thermophilus JL-18]
MIGEAASQERPGKRKKGKAFTGAHALLVFPSGEDHKATLDLMRRFSAAVRYAYNRLLEGWSREALKRENGPLRIFFGLNTRYADDAILKAQALLDSARERGEDPRKVVFGGRRLFETLKRRHLSGKPLKRLKREWRERRQGLLYSRGDKTKGGNLNLRLFVKEGALWLRINLGNGTYVHALVKTSHPNLSVLLQRVYASLLYNVELSLKEGKVHATFTWEEEPAPLAATKENGVLALDVNSDPYHLALALVSPDGNLRRHLTLSLEEVDRAPNRGAKELLLWKIAHEVVSLALEHGVAIATERLKYLPKGRRGDGSGRAFRRKAHRFAYASLLRKVHALARKKGVQVVEVNPQDTSTIGMLKYAPLLSLSKDVAAAYVIGRRALGFAEKLPRGYGKLLREERFRGHVQGFYASRVQELRAKRKAESNPYLRRRLSQELERAKRHLSLLSSLQGSPGSQEGSTNGRNPIGVNPWRVLRVGLFLPLLGREVPRDLSRLKPILFGGAWEGWKGGLGPHPGGGPECVNVRST